MKIDAHRAWQKAKIEVLKGHLENYNSLEFADIRVINAVEDRIHKIQNEYLSNIPTTYI